MLKDFKEFALKGNMVDLAIGVIIGTAFGGLVNSIVADFITPVIGFLTGGLDFSNMFIQLAGQPKETLSAAREAGATIAYGHFLTLFINFMIVAAVLFMVVKAMNRLKRKEAAAPAPVPELSRDQALLTEIRDLLAKQQGRG